MTFGLRLLHEEDYFETGIHANAALAERGVKELSVETADLYEAERLAQLVQRCVIDPVNGERLFANTAQVREAFLRADLSVIAETYLEFEQQYNPTDRNMTEVQMQAVIEEVKKVGKRRF